ncbi:pyrimidine-nucleoside phosphorylase [Aerococcus suis]|uniref:Pyrimidine-nucleoside phosphorylase n=1 Tax=Aerococcus suis TaxID=371602 RepID=A0A1W1Y4E0_9LACT|nr:pyrimidine-nucleoside phosphorylase [Aerococcus suis]MCI7240077.1 pyrimidine-nucleoside phosphorylase [Aerococcus suis]MDD7758054.1 pyrimidine-nucleoside phosphorylase [Aerococcus suis]MDY4646317.1 pyrimidine-nucleoside phosphorylase [Aerococcus suis]SMC30997.1 pyrimidine-nucleoside phosphorylase [Aerococcus suis]
MRAVDIIEKKRNGLELTDEEIKWIIDNYTNDSIPDYQMSALLMAIYFQGMNKHEAATMTKAMVESGDQIDLSDIEGIKVDKHSTGGVGDTTTIILAPLVASVGAPIAKMSGRGLGHTGGTLDKLEAIPGFHIELTSDEFIDAVNKHKIAVIGQTGNLTPADKRIYALRDVTGTVNSIPLIASSIMSKKIAAGSDAIVLDVKVGSGAFMKTVEDANRLGQTMVEIGEKVGRRTMVVVSDMSQPLGRAIGNALEVKEAIETLRGEGPEDLTELVLTLGSQMVVLGGKAETLDEARSLLEEAIQSGKALDKLKEFLTTQGGDANVVDDPSLLAQAKYQIELPAQRSGKISEMQAEKIGIASMLLGAGRASKEDEIDMAVGIVLNKKIGDDVKEGESILTIHSNREDVSDVVELLQENITIADEASEPKLILNTITK